MWIVYAALSAFFAALTSILAKIGIENVNSNLATAIRTVVVLVLAWGIVFIAGKNQGIYSIGQKSWIFLILSGCATGLSWIFYYRALQLGEVSKVIAIDKFSLVIGIVLAFIILRENIDTKTIVGGALITIGTLVLIL
ncbi:MAG: EamA family transporter [Synergistaceae bacterium]|jgi:transporter family protein|nr:EamA family transporter [Synergistaceae bacterium]